MSSLGEFHSNSRGRGRGRGTMPAPSFPINNHVPLMSSLSKAHEDPQGQEKEQEAMDDILQHWVKENDFLLFESIEEQEERRAKQRREERLKKLQQLKKEYEIDTTTTSNSSRKKQKLDQERLNLDSDNIRMKSFHDEDDAVCNHNKIINNMDPQHQNEMNDKEKENEEEEEEDDSFDMFTSSVTPPIRKDSGPTTTIIATAAVGLGLDDAEGYYKASIGEMISFPMEHYPMDDKNTVVPTPPTVLSFRVLGIIGKGVFSTVLKCIHESSLSSTSTSNIPDQHFVAIKLIRSNETMTKAAMKEVRILRLLHSKSNTSSSSSKKVSQSEKQENFIVKMIDLYTEINHSTSDPSYLTTPMLEYHNHTAILFEYFPYNLRETLGKFGKNLGINLNAVRSYARQLICALQHLALHRIVHADIKLDNILVSENFSMVKICDFGSAFFETDSDNVPTPYLVSRFYRAPEVILGLEYDRAIDLWSVAVSLAELFTGTVMFPGRNNNDMLKRFMDCIGPFSTKMIRRHVSSFTKLGIVPHFEPIVEGSNYYNFRKHELDQVTERPVVRMVNANSAAIPSKQIQHVMLKSRSTSDGRGDVIKFSDLLTKCLTLDPLKRISLDVILDHEFFVVHKTSNTDA